MKKQLVIFTDMEGASGIFEENYKAKIHGTEEWKNEGRECMTSDVLAVCEAANECGIDEILIYDAHFAGNPEHNIIIEKLPPNVKFFDTPDRCFWWRRIRGQAEWEPYGIITVGQHARYGEENAYFPHTIQSPPIRSLTINEMNIAEIGTAVLNFQGVKYIANVGCEASMKEARELSDTVATISVKDKSKNWEPSIRETYPIIKAGILQALINIDNKTSVNIKEPYEFSMTVMDGFKYNTPERISWKGSFDENKASWEAPSVEIGLEIFNYVRECIVKEC
ncbi:MAG: M55 family metallopeptidase [Clostridium sp.]|uniref:M55 family metallopeptidase n=1 Tax=Clostridium sp. TaxID=1506 RepID=UPI00306126BB